MSKIRQISLFFLLMAVAVLLAGRLLPHHHHTIRVDGVEALEVVCWGNVHCVYCEYHHHERCEQHEDKESRCPTDSDIIFEPHDDVCRIIQKSESVSPIFSALLFNDEVKVYPSSLHRRLQSVNLKIPDVFSLVKRLRAPPFV